MRYSLHFPNVTTAREGSRSDSFTASVAAGTSAGFEFAVFEHSPVDDSARRLASWSPITGLRMHER